MSFNTADLEQALKDNGIDALFPDTSAHLSPTPRNKRKVVYPEAITFPISPEQVAKIVKIGKQFERHVVALSGGHSSIGNSIGGFHGALVISLKKLKKIEYNPYTDLVTIQTGSTLAEVDEELAKHKRAIAHGTCGTVGVGGHAAFGGFGLTTRMWGLNCDLIRSMKVVKDNGDLVYISEHMNPDLFWAMRGAAPSFAIATELTYITYPEIPKVDVHPIEFDRWMYYDELASAFQTFQLRAAAEADYAPKELSVDFIVESAGPSDWVNITVRGVYYGPKQVYNRICKELKWVFSDSNTKTKRGLTKGKPLPPAGATSKHHGVSADYYSFNARIAADPYWTGDLIALGRAKAAGQSRAGKRNQYDLISFYIKTLWSPALDYDALSAFLKYLALNAPPSLLNYSVRFKLLGGKNSVLPASGSTSFGWRDAFWYIEMDTWAYLYDVPSYPEDGYIFLDDLSKTMTDKMPNAKFGAYAGCLDDRLENCNDYYYGENHERLKKIRREQAGNGVFVFPQCIEQ